MCVAVVGGGGGVGIFNDIWLRFRSSAEQTALFFFFLISISVSRKFSLYSVKLTITQVTSLFAVCRYVGWAKSPGAYIAKQWAYSRHVYRKLHGNCENTLFTHEYVVHLSEIKWANECDFWQKKNDCVTPFKAISMTFTILSAFFFQIFPNCFNDKICRSTPRNDEEILLLFGRISTICFIQHEINKTIPVQFPICFSLFSF